MAQRDLVVRITGNESDYLRSVKATNAATAKLGTTVESTSTRVTSSLKGLGSAVAGGFALSTVFSEYQEAAKVGARTNQVIATTGSVAGVTAGHVGKLADSLARTAGMDDDVIQAGENVLLTFTNIRNTPLHKTFDEATRAAVDLAAGMGTDVPTAAKSLGLALADPEKAMRKLRAMNVVLTTEQNEQIKSAIKQGHVAEAQQVIIDAVATRYGGSAEAMATDADKARASALQLAESLGRDLAPAMNLLSKVAGGAADVLSHLPGPVQQLIVVGGLGALAWRKYSIAAQEAAIRQAQVAATAPAAAAGVTEVGDAAVVATAETEGLSLSLGTLAAAATAGIGSFAGTTAILNYATDTKTAKFSTDGLAASMDLLGTKGKVGGELEKNFGPGLEKLADDIKNLDRSGMSKVWSSFGPGGDLSTGLKASSKDIDQLDKQLAELVSNGHAEEAMQQFGQLVLLLRAQGISTERIAELFNDYGDAVDNSAVANEAAAAPEESAIDRQKRLAAAAKEVADALRAQDAAAGDHIDAIKATDDARTQLAEDEIAYQVALKGGVVDTEALTAAEKQLVDSHKAVDSAVKAEAQAERDAADAKQKVTDAQNDLNEARRKAPDYLADMILAEQEASDAVGAASLALRRAQDEERRTRGNAKSTDLEKAEAAQKVKEAQTALAAAKQKAKEAGEANAEAQQKGVDGTPDVVAATEALKNAQDQARQSQERVIEARQAVTEANGRVAESEANLSKVEQEAEAKRHQAKLDAIVLGKKVADDLVNLAEKNTALSKNTDSAEQAHERLIAQLLVMQATLAPGSPLRRELEDYVRLLGYVGSIPGGTSGPSIGSSGGSGGRPGSPIIPGRGTFNSVANPDGGSLITQHFHVGGGITEHEFRKVHVLAKGTAKDALDNLARSVS